MSYITSTACNALRLSSDTSISNQIQEWIAYILFAQCPQHSISTIVNTVFLALAAWQALSMKNGGKPIAFRCTKIAKGFIFTLVLSTCFSIISAALVAFSIYTCIEYGDTTHSIRESVFACVEAAAWISSTTILAYETKAGSPKYGMVLRVWWFSVACVSLAGLLSSIFRLVRSQGLGYDLLLEVEDIYAIVRCPVSAYLAYKAIYATTGIRASVLVDENLEAPLLKSANGGPGSSISTTSGFTSASFFSKVVISWLTPVLVAGSKQSLGVNDVPELSPTDSAQSVYALLQRNWPQTSVSTRPMTISILKSFWPQIIYTGLLQFVRSFAMYCGPLLIPGFTSYAQGVYVSPFDGYSLVLLLFLSKIIEVVTYHQYNFLCYKLGNNVRTGIVTMLYHKALRLSSSSRQFHGVGQITNYMQVDAQQISDACLQLHLLWAVPLQVIIALVILFYVLGLSSLAGMVILILVALLTAYISEKQRYYQQFVMKCRDTRMKSIIEALAYIKVIKLQAWEEKFRKRVEEFRQEEYNWLSRFVRATAYNMFVLWNTQPFVSTVTYLVAILIGTPLSTSIIFTASSVFRIIQSPIRNFPQSLISLSQSLVSLERLDKFMLSAELQKGAVVKHPVVDDFPVVVEDGAFCWDENEKKAILSDINLRIKKGSLVTIVGTVGSGKSSLLSGLLGEMVKLSGKAKTSGRVAYVSQTAWIQNATIEDNILFGTSKDSARYEQVLQACALVQDLEAWACPQLRDRAWESGHQFEYGQPSTLPSSRFQGSPGASGQRSEVRVGEQPYPLVCLAGPLSQGF